MESVYCTKVNLISALKQCGYYIMLSSIHILHTALRFGVTHTNLIWSHWLNCKSVLLEQLLEPVSMRIPHPYSVSWNFWTSRKFIFIVCSYSCVNTITVFCLHFFRISMYEIIQFLNIISGNRIFFMCHWYSQNHIWIKKSMSLLFVTKCKNDTTPYIFFSDKSMAANHPVAPGARTSAAWVLVYM